MRIYSIPFEVELSSGLFTDATEDFQSDANKSSYKDRMWSSYFISNCKKYGTMQSSPLLRNNKIWHTHTHTKQTKYTKWICKIHISMQHVTQIHQNINLYQYIDMINLADVFTVLRNISFIWHICLYIHVTALSGTSSLDGAIPLASRDNSPLHFRTRPRWVDSCHFHDLLISPWRWTEINNKRNHFL